MTDARNKLRVVEYTRQYVAERDVHVHLLASSQWGRDLELILEDAWKNLKCNPDAKSAAEGLENEVPSLILIEPKAYDEDTFRWLDMSIQLKVRSILIAPEDISMFDWMSLTRRAAAIDVGGILLSKDSRTAASELNSILIDAVALNADQNQKDVQYIKSAAAGFRLVFDTDTENLEREIFSLIADEFMLSSYHLALIFVLLDTYSLWKKPKDSQSDLHYAYKRIEREIEGTDAEKALQTALSVKRNCSSGEITEETWAKILTEAGYGILARRRLQKKIPELRLLLTLGLQENKVLKIA